MYCFLSITEYMKENLKVLCILGGYVGAVSFLASKGIILSALCKARWKRGSINVKPRLASENFVFILFCYKLLCDDHIVTPSDIYNEKRHKATYIKNQNSDVSRVCKLAVQLPRQYKYFRPL